MTTVNDVQAEALRQIIVVQGRQFGCDRCQEIQPGFTEMVRPYMLSDVRIVQQMVKDNTFCTCTTGTNLEAAALRRLNVDEQDIANHQRRAKLLQRIDELFPDWTIPVEFRPEHMTIRSWAQKFSGDGKKSIALDALYSLGNSGKISTDYGEWSGVLLHGLAGTGKTGGAACLLKKMQADGHPVLFLTLGDILLMTNWQDDKVAERNRIDLLGRVPVLCIDELVHPGQNITDHERTRILFSIIDNRYKRKLPTMATTNCTLTELKEKLGDMTYERLLTLCAPVEVAGGSGRQIVENAYGTTNVLA